ncbi:MAG: hypothetical protein IPL15_00015 [Comamonadaceae bacterium]|uniref:hypothetical protein n=1 Tax=Candidatus Skiveiella danica TaxID=3386177 RepID=UPI003909E68D|nr:hypothetical protein [Comamonadaceae bacterium]
MEAKGVKPRLALVEHLQRRAVISTMARLAPDFAFHGGNQAFQPIGIDHVTRPCSYHLPAACRALVVPGAGHPTISNEFKAGFIRLPRRACTESEGTREHEQLPRPGLLAQGIA